MNAAEHIAEAERLLDEASTTTIVSVRGRLSLDESERIKAKVHEIIGDQPVLVLDESVTVDMSAALLAAQAHATVALAMREAGDVVLNTLDGKAIEKALNEHLRSTGRRTLP